MEKKLKPQSTSTSMIAKKDHVIKQNNVNIVIKKGDNLQEMDIPERFKETLKTEQII